jgi:uncharacterized protein with von Willebrand factor type A (vWA) domain
MHPNELMGARGNIDPSRETDTPGIEWLQRFRDHFERCVWLNPEPLRTWDSYQTTRAVRHLFPMHPLSVDGITDAVASLIGSRATLAIA